jgi:hypothetical protein
MVLKEFDYKICNAMVLATIGIAFLLMIIAAIDQLVFSYYNLTYIFGGISFASLALAMYVLFEMEKLKQKLNISIH